MRLSELLELFEQNHRRCHLSARKKQGLWPAWTWRGDSTLSSKARS